MRISSAQIQQLALRAMLDQQARLSKTQQQVSTGKRILTPSDDPAAAAGLLGLDQSLSISKQYQDNISIARNHLQGEEAALDSITKAMDRVREIAVQGNNAPLTSSDRSALAVEVRQRLDELLALANNRDASGEYTFAGLQSKTQPFTVNSSGVYQYNGDSGQRLQQIGSSRQVAIGDSGTAVFRAIREGNGTFATQDNQGNIGSGVIGPGTVTDPTAYDGDTYTLSFPVQTPASATLSFGDAIGTNDNLNYTLQINGTTVYSVSESGTPVNTLSGLASAINTGSATTGVRAIVDNGTLSLVNTAPGNQPIVVTESMSGGSDGDADTVTGYFGSALTGTSAASANLTYNNTDATNYVVENSQGTLVTSGNYQASSSISFNGVSVAFKGTPRNGDSFTIRPSAQQDLFSNVEALARALESPISATGSQAAFNNAMSRFLANADQDQEHISTVRARIGARINTIDSQQGLNDAVIFQVQETRSRLQDLDYASAITRLNQQTVGLEAAQKSFLQIQGLSLFSLL